MGYGTWPTTLTPPRLTKGPVGGGRTVAIEDQAVQGLDQNDQDALRGLGYMITCAT